MKKIIALILTTLAIATLFTGCGKKNQTDLEYVKEKGTLIVGVTDFEPMDYKKGSEWIGFDADLAKKFGKSLGVKVEFTEINWDNKVMELDGKQIDCVWNGMTLTDEVKNAMSTSEAYCNNSQVIVIKKGAKISDTAKEGDDFKGYKFAVEKGSAGKDMAEKYGYEYTEVDSQAKALMEVNAGTANCAIIDSLMAAAMVGEGTSYSNLKYTVSLNEELYGVGFRKNSDLTAKLNEFFKTAKEDGTMQAIAEQYKVQAALIK